jgi:5-methylthioadenosine/S-adenosylhomocysteine deaminase
LDADIGSIESGKYADLVILDLRGAHAAGPDDIYTQLVYSARATDVRSVMVGGRVLVRDGQLTELDEAEIVAEAARQREQLVGRAGLPAS